MSEYSGPRGLEGDQKGSCDLCPSSHGMLRVHVWDLRISLPSLSLATLCRAFICHVVSRLLSTYTGKLSVPMVFFSDRPGHLDQEGHRREGRRAARQGHRSRRAAFGRGYRELVPPAFSFSGTAVVLSVIFIVESVVVVVLLPPCCCCCRWCSAPVRQSPHTQRRGRRRFARTTFLKVLALHTHTYNISFGP